MTWILEEPLPVILLGMATAAILGGFWLNTGRRTFLQWMIAVLVLTVASVGLERLVQTDREQVEETLREIARLVERNESAKALSYIHATRPEIRRIAERDLKRFEFEQIRIKQNLKIVVVEQSDPPEARATFNVVVVLAKAPPGMDAHQKRYPVYVEVGFRKEADQWQVVDYARDNAMAGFQRR